MVMIVILMRTVGSQKSLNLDILIILKYSVDCKNNVLKLYLDPQLSKLIKK